MTTRKMRNYKAMKDEKLLSCYDDLCEEGGDAFDRCLHKGSGDVQADRQFIHGLLKSRGLI